ncbi:putative winged helix-turn-helix DNA-binding domain-containing protein [Lupinus albus]|uniref:Putative winged helix-turn-helix DNA-binding domain-containing protein n=1 Tax=Lupinus albus TaxID=3870 RepID=A0A6A4QZX9_LUPAL|nr:putative winged helix-turn-helix DNA-binding domain-containing protein [Lupinus albus]
MGVCSTYLPRVRENRGLHCDGERIKSVESCLKTVKRLSIRAFADMIVEAILNLKERTGSSQYAIAKFIEEKHKDLPATFKKLILHNLKKSVAAGKLVKVKCSFKLAPTVKAVVVADSKKPKTVSKPNAKTVSKAKPKTTAKSEAITKPKAKAVSGGAKAKVKIVKSPVKKVDAKPAKKAPLKTVKKTKSVKSPVKKVAAKKAKK